jgi:dihydroorotase
MLDLLIQNTTLIQSSKTISKSFSLGIKNKKIAFIGQEQLPIAKRYIDGSNLYTLPGIIDSHVHFRSPGFEHKEDFISGSKAAIAGGVTTVFDMPNTSPPIDSVKKLEKKIKDTGGNSYVNFKQHFLLTNKNKEEIINLDPRSIATVKVFMAGHETANEVVYDPDYILEIAKILKEKGIIMSVHAEFQPSFEKRSVINTPEDYTKVKTRKAAIDAVEILIKIAIKTGCHIHVLHVSTIEEVQLLNKAKKEGVSISYEFIPPHLWFTCTDFHRNGWNYKLSPPLREEKDIDFLWEQVINNQVDLIGSDHAPHTVFEKKTLHPAGMPGVQELFNSMFTGLSRRGIDDIEAFKIIVRLLCENPSKLFNLKNKGILLEGKDADIVLFSTQKKCDKKIHAKCKWSPFNYEEFKGNVELTIVNGSIVFENGNVQQKVPGESLGNI